tara:strand:- start:2015 stop:2287 length:273 start_codon:yes stop_codon:yes gene_type:complete
MDKETKKYIDNVKKFIDIDIKLSKSLIDSNRNSLKSVDGSLASDGRRIDGLADDLKELKKEHDSDYAKLKKELDRIKAVLVAMGKKKGNG